MKWLNDLIMSYFKEINNQAPLDVDELEYMCNKLMGDMERTIQARKDFKKEDNNG